MNSMFKPYLPVDREGFVTIANPNQILDKEINLKPLIHCLKKADLHLDVRTNAEVIVLTDEENEHDSESNFTSNHDESNEYDWHSASSQMGIHPTTSSAHGQHVIETVSIDSPPPSSSTQQQDANERLALFDRSPSMTSLESCDLNLDTPDLLAATDRNVKHEMQLDAANEQEDDPQPSTSYAESLSSTSKETPSTSKEMVTAEGNANKTDTLTSLNESLFNRLVSDINSTHLSVPADVNISAESKLSDTSECDRPVIDNSAEAINSEEASKCDMSIENDPQIPIDNDAQSNSILPKSIDIVHSTTTTTTSSSSSTYINKNVDQTTADQPTSSVTHNDIDTVSNSGSGKMGNVAENDSTTQPMGPDQRICADTETNITSSDSPLNNHEETLQNIEEIVTDDLKGQEEMDTSGVANVELDDVDDGLGNEKPAVDGDNNNSDGSLLMEQQQASQEFLPAAESTASVCAETSLLSKSEQDVLFKDRDAAEMFNDLWSSNNGSQTNDDQPSSAKVAPASPAMIPKSPTTTSTPHSAHQSTSPLEFRGNGLDANARVKTYARRRQTTPRVIEMKTMSTQTTRAGPSPITTIIDDAGTGSQQKDKHLMTEKVDDELFLRDIFHTPPDVVASRLRSSPRIKSPIMYPAPSTPTVAPTVVATANVATFCNAAATSFTDDESTVLHTTVETTGNSTAAGATTTATSSMFGSTLETTVKRKRGRPRKYPLPEPGEAPPPKPPRQPRKPRKPRSPERDEDGEIIVFERMVLRERKPKPPPPPPPPVQTRRSRSKKRGRKPKNKEETTSTSPSKRKPAQPRQTKAATTRAARAAASAARAAVQKTTKQMAGDEKPRRGRPKRRNTIKMTIDAIFNAQSPQISAIQARRISHILGIPFSAPQLTTILKRRNYNKSVNASNSSQVRVNGQMNSTDPDAQATNATVNGDGSTTVASTSMPAPTSSTPSTILARKTYIKPDLSFSSLSNALRRMSRRISRRMSRRMSRRISFGTRRISFSSSMPRHPSVQMRPTNTRKNRKQSPQKSQSQQQRYEAIDIFDTSTKGKRGRKKGSKNSTPSKPRTPSKRKKEVASSHMMSINAWEQQQQQLQQQYHQQQQQQQLQQLQHQPLPQQLVQHHYHQHSNVEIFETIGDTIELVDLTEEIAPFELDATNEMQMQFQNIEPALSSTQHIHPHDSFMGASSNKFPDYSRLDDIETDATFTTDPDSAVEDADDSRTRKSKRSRKRPKILDL